MAKMTKAQLVEALSGKGLEIAEDNPNLTTIARSLGVLVTPQHTTRVLFYDGKAKEEVPEPTEKSRTFVAVSGGARGREAWFPVKADSDPMDCVRSLAASCSELLGE